MRNSPPGIHNIYCSRGSGRGNTYLLQQYHQSSLTKNITQIEQSIIKSLLRSHKAEEYKLLLILNVSFWTHCVLQFFLVWLCVCNQKCSVVWTAELRWGIWISVWQCTYSHTGYFSKYWSNFDKAWINDVNCCQRLLQHINETKTVSYTGSLFEIGAITWGSKYSKMSNK